MGESRKDALRVNFYHKLKLEFHGTKVTSDAGLLAFRELDEALGLTATIESDFCDNRKGRNTQHNIIALLRQSVYGEAFEICNLSNGRGDGIKVVVLRYS